jgi:hypothetical protein
MKNTLALLFAVNILLLTGCTSAYHVTKTGGFTKLTDWGTVELSANAAKHLSLGENQDCTVTATLLASGDLQVVIKSEGKLADAQTPTGVPPGTPVETTQAMTVRSGVEIVVYVGQKLVRFTPKFKA